MPLAAKDNLDELYAVQRLLQKEIVRLQQEAEASLESRANGRQYILKLQIEALQEEAARLSARISDILERDLQR